MGIADRRSPHVPPSAAISGLLNKVCASGSGSSARGAISYRVITAVLLAQPHEWRWGAAWAQLTGTPAYYSRMAEIS